MQFLCVRLLSAWRFSDLPRGLGMPWHAMHLSPSGKPSGNRPIASSPNKGCKAGRGPGRANASEREARVVPDGMRRWDGERYQPPPLVMKSFKLKLILGDVGVGVAIHGLAEQRGTMGVIPEGDSFYAIQGWA